jgi:MioC protein
MRVGIISGTVFGTADLVADEAASMLAGAGHEPVRLRPATVDALLELNADAWLLVSSTTGMGELPETLTPFFFEMRDRFPLLTGKPFGVIALGDSAYGDTFCQGGEQLRELWLELQAQEMQPMLRLDASESVTPEEDAAPWLQTFAAQLG